ncbi:hypothetical protein [Prescottella equi]|uniref:hypothetical protein n=1 Tax=Rhodococcus hoagii TaxID=43767 RepID=UPI000D0EEEA5|nr:hypothetical protein [Prescottella equi]AVP71326.1 hypothetical protein C7H75_24910 [Prescottella equi]
MLATITRKARFADAERYSAAVADADLADQLAQLVEGYWHFQARLDALQGPAGKALPWRTRRRHIRAARFVAETTYARAAVLSDRIAKLIY